VGSTRHCAHTNQNAVSSSMEYEWSKSDKPDWSAEKSTDSLTSYLSLTREKQHAVPNQTFANANNSLAYKAEAGNQASLAARHREKKTLEGIRFPFQGSYGDYFVNWTDVEPTLDALSTFVRDDAALYIISYLTNRSELDVLADDARGRKILVRLYDELTSGSVWDDERSSADSVAASLKRSADPKTFTRLVDPKAAPVIPISKDGLTHGSWVHAERLPSGRIFIKPSSSGEDWNLKQNYPDFFELQGAEFDPQDVLNVVLTDVSPVPQPILAVEFLSFSNANEYELLKKGIESAIAGASLPFAGAGFGGQAVLEGVAANSPKLARLLSLTSGVSATSMALARGISTAIEAADTLALAWGSVSVFIHSIEGGLIRQYGNEASQLLRWVRLLDTIASVYGFARVAGDVANLLDSIAQKSRYLRNLSKGATHATGDESKLDSALEVIIDKTDELSKQQKQILKLSEGQLAGKSSPKAKPSSPAFTDSVSSPVQHPAFESTSRRGPDLGEAHVPEGTPDASTIDAINSAKSPKASLEPAERRIQLSADSSLRDKPSLPAHENPTMQAARRTPAEEAHFNLEYDSYKTRKGIHDINREPSPARNEEFQELNEAWEDLSLPTAGPPPSQKIRAAIAGTERDQAFRNITASILKEQGLEGRLFTPGDWGAVAEKLKLNPDTVFNGDLLWVKGGGPDVLFIDAERRVVKSVDLTSKPDAGHFAEKKLQIKRLGELLNSGKPATERWTVEFVADLHLAGKTMNTKTILADETFRQLCLEFGWSSP